MKYVTKKELQNKIEELKKRDWAKILVINFEDASQWTVEPLKDGSDEKLVTYDKIIIGYQDIEKTIWKAFQNKDNKIVEVWFDDIY